jgi:hypothetical protein
MNGIIVKQVMGYQCFFFFFFLKKKKITQYNRYYPNKLIVLFPRINATLI